MGIPEAVFSARRIRGLIIMTFVSVGNAKHPFHRLLKGVAVIASKLPQPVVVQHGHTPFESPLCKAKAFMNINN